MRFGMRSKVPEICGQSYKQFTIIIYDPRVVIWAIFGSGMPLDS